MEYVFFFTQVKLHKSTMASLYASLEFLPITS
jgi:hypothetical protein